MVYNRLEKEHHLWIRRIALGSKVPWKKFMEDRDYDRLVKRLGPKALAAMSQREFVQMGVRFNEVPTVLNSEVDRQMRLFENTQYIDVREFVGWTLYPSVLWASSVSKAH